MAQIAIPIALEGAELAEGTAAASALKQGANRVFKNGIGQGIKEGGENLMSKVLPSIKRAGSKVIEYVPRFGSKTAKPIVQKVAKEEVKQVAKTGAKALVKEGAEVGKESFKKKAVDALVLGGIVPGVGFSIAGNLAGQPSSSSNPDVTKGDLLKAHKQAKGNHNDLMNYKFDNGQTFKEVQGNYFKDNKAKLKKAENNPSLLYTKTGKPTMLHKTAKLHGIKLDNTK